jgi:hypothetical protein
VDAWIMQKVCFLIRRIAPPHRRPLDQPVRKRRQYFSHLRTAMLTPSEQIFWLLTLAAPVSAVS